MTAIRVVLALSHSCEEFQQLDLLTSLGYEVASIGGYINPHAPHDGKRPPLPHVPYFPEVQEAVDALGTADNLGAAQSRIPEPVLDWLGPTGILIFHHYLQRLYGQWEHLREWRQAGGRVIWRTVGQSVEQNERDAAPYRDDGLEIVRYSPKERAIPGYAGEDALIRFWEHEMEWCAWSGERRTVINITQGLRRRDPWTNWGAWEAATAGLPRLPLGPGSEEIGGPGEVSYDELRWWLRHARAYLYCGTQPAAYTLGLLEALMTGVPVVSIGPAWMNIFPYGPELFEGHELAPLWSDDMDEARTMLQELLDDQDYAARVSAEQRDRARALFGREVAAAAWRSYLGKP